MRACVGATRRWEGCLREGGCEEDMSCFASARLWLWGTLEDAECKGSRVGALRKGLRSRISEGVWDSSGGVG